MNKSLLIGIISGAALATAGGVWAGYGMLADKPATVATTSDTAGGQECFDVAEERQVDPKDDKRIAGTLIGAVVGGAIGNQVGDGSGKKAATVVGAAGGAYAGNRAQDSFQENNTETVMERRCVDK